MKLTCLKLYPHECEVGKHKYELQIRIMLSELSTYNILHGAKIFMAHPWDMVGKKFDWKAIKPFSRLLWQSAPALFPLSSPLIYGE